MENLSSITITLLALYSIGSTLLFLFLYRPFKNNIIDYLNKSLRDQTKAKDHFSLECINLNAEKSSIKHELEHEKKLKETFREMYFKNVSPGIDGRPIGFFLKSAANVEDDFLINGAVLLKKSIVVKWEDVFEGEEEKAQIVTELIENDMVPDHLKEVITDIDYLTVSTIVEKNDENGESVFERNRTYQEILNEFNDKIKNIEKAIDELVSEAMLANLIQKTLNK
jgi:hypothetical protein